MACCEISCAQQREQHLRREGKRRELAGTTYAAAVGFDAADEAILLHCRLVDPLARLGEQLLLLAAQYAHPNHLTRGKRE